MGTRHGAYHHLWNVNVQSEPDSMVHNQVLPEKIGVCVDMAAVLNQNQKQAVMN